MLRNRPSGLKSKAYDGKTLFPYEGDRVIVAMGRLIIDGIDHCQQQQQEMWPTKDVASKGFACRLLSVK